MYIIVGLGNPGREYEATRHNVGFEAIDCLADKHGIDVSMKAHKAILGKGVINGQKVILAKPQTYMNLSGESVRAICDYYKVDPTEALIVLSDDISLEPGRIRIRKKGSAGGHNGLKNIIAQCGTDGFSRVKIGVGEKPKGRDLADWVMSRFDRENREKVEDAYERTAAAVELMIQDETDKAMNLYN